MKLEKYYAVNHHPDTIRDIGIDCSEPKLTDQSQAMDADINVIMKRFEKTGVLPESTNLGDYIDATEIPDLAEAMHLSKRAEQLFKDLPVDIRKMIDHDPMQLQEFISNAENHDILKKHGLINIKEEVKNQEKIDEGSKQA